MNKCEFLTFEHSLIFNFERSNVLYPHNHWLNSTFLTINYYVLAVLWLKHQLKDNKVVTGKYETKFFKCL